MTYGLDISKIPSAMPRLLKGRVLKWFMANNRLWGTWTEFIQSFQPKGFITKLADEDHQTIWWTWRPYCDS